jgi:alpha-tubulin suppressor-like RCC1 family protein/outer membrane protein OmpA-like peptidoglycan-associated protein
MNTSTSVIHPKKISRIFGASVALVFAIAGAAVTFADANETDPSGPLSHVQSSIAIGGLHSCALLSTGTVKCWGSNGLGQLGTGSTSPSQSNVPVDVSGLTDVIAITAGDAHTCALVSNGTVKCWGDSVYGRLGIGTPGTPRIKPSPLDVTGLTDVTAITAGAYHTCALINDGTVKCWGRNNDGQLGNNSTASSDVPVSVSGLTSVTAISAGGGEMPDFSESGHTCALLTSGAVQCWGDNSRYQLGQGGTSRVDKLIPSQVSGLTDGVSAISVGKTHSCALLSSGSVQCWGVNGGGLGNGTSTESSTPVSVSGVTTATAITTGDAHSCVRLATGAINCWGSNSFGQLGDNTQIAKTTPVAVNGIDNATAVSAGRSHACAILSTGSMQCWGYNFYGQLGNNSGTSSPVPVQVQNLTSGVGATTTTTSNIAPTTTIASSSTTTPSTTSGETSPSTGAVVPGVTITDPTIYTTPPKRVAEGSAITVLTETQTKTQQLRSTTPDVCLPTKDDIVFIDTGLCNVSVLSKKSGAILRILRTTVIESDVVELGIGNEIATLAPIYFNNGSSELTPIAKRRIASLKGRVSAAGSVMVVGHSGIMLGDTQENRALSKDRAVNTVKTLKRFGARGPFFSVAVGALDPEVKDTSRSAQTRNRRVVIVLIP